MKGSLFVHNLTSSKTRLQDFVDINKETTFEDLLKMVKEKVSGDLEKISIFGRTMPIVVWETGDFLPLFEGKESILDRFKVDSEFLCIIIDVIKLKSLF